MRKSLLMLFLLAALCLCGCAAGSGGGAAGDASDSAETADSPDSAGDDSAGDDSAGDDSVGNDSADDVDNPRNQDGIGERELLVVSFGTSYNDTRRLSIGGIEDALAEAFPDWDVRRAFTSQIVLDHVAERDGVSMDNVGAALDRAAANGVQILAIQPTHIMDGYEYGDLVKEVMERAHEFHATAIGSPLLTSEEDYSRTAEAVGNALNEYDDGETALCLMGHGTEADSNAVYSRMQAVFAEKGMEHYYVGTVEAEPSLEDVLAAVQAGEYQRVVLMPLMIVAGDHASNDMAGDEPDSWKSVFAAAGYEVICVLHGLGELPEIQAIFVDHAREAAKGVSAAGNGAENRTEPSGGAAEVSGGAAEPSGASGADGAAGTAAAPVTAVELREGTYHIEAESSSSMFRITDCVLTVSGGTMTAAMTMGGTGYLYVCPGTAEEAAASLDQYIPYTENADGSHVFTIPVPALNAEVPCAAYSRNKEQWYDRTLCFRSDSLPLDAFVEVAYTPLLAPTSPVIPEDGTWTVEVDFSGGTGRASVLSPAVLTVRDGACTARIEWTSPNYDYMIVDGKTCLPVNTEGNSVFEIPVKSLDIPLPVTADTTAMSQPHEIDYTLVFLSATLREAEG